MTALRLGVDGRELRAGARTGIRRYLVEVLRAASRAGWTCIVYGDETTRLDLALPGVTCRLLSRAWTQWWDQVSLPRALAQDGLSVFLSPYYKSPLRTRCPVVLTIHDLFFIGYPGQRRIIRDALTTQLARLYARHATAIIADSEYSKRSTIARLRAAPSKVVVIPVALGPEFKPETLSAEARARYRLTSQYILYIGNFKPHKNLPRLLHAYAKLPDVLRATYTLVLPGGAGAGRDELGSLAATLGIETRVQFPGWIDDADLPGVYSEAALLVIPSLDEGFGLPALEAMACGAPVVASNRGALPEVVGDAGILIDPESENGLTQAMSDVLTQETRRHTLRERGFTQAARFSVDRTSDRVVQLLVDVATRDRRGTKRERVGVRAV